MCRACRSVSPEIPRIHRDIRSLAIRGYGFLAFLLIATGIKHPSSSYTSTKTGTHTFMLKPLQLWVAPLWYPTVSQMVLHNDQATLHYSHRSPRSREDNYLSEAPPLPPTGGHRLVRRFPRRTPPPPPRPPPRRPPPTTAFRIHHWRTFFLHQRPLGQDHLPHPRGKTGCSHAAQTAMLQPNEEKGAP